MDDQALLGAVGPAIEDRIAAALGTEPERVNLDKPVDEGLPRGDVDNAPAETLTADPGATAEPVENLDEPPKWDDVREIKVRVPVKNGAEEKEIETTLDELRLGYMRQDDYQRKTQEVAAARTNAQTEAQKAVAQIQQRFETELRTMNTWLQNVAVPELQQVDWNRLATDDPAEFVRMSHRANQVRQAQEKVRQQLQTTENQRKTVEQQRRAQALAQASEQLRTEIPNWGDELQKTLVKTGSEAGYSPEELSSVSDPRLVKLLWKAQQFDAIKAQQPIADKKVSDAPKVLKPSAPLQRGTQGAKVDALRARIKKSGGHDKMAIEELIKTKLR